MITKNYKRIPPPIEVEDEYEFKSKLIDIKTN